jgi:hypothetical protein
VRIRAISCKFFQVSGIAKIRDCFFPNNFIIRTVLMMNFFELRIYVNSGDFARICDLVAAL